MINKIRTSVRWKIAIISAGTLCAACILSFAIVLGGFLLLYQGEYTALTSGLLLLATCFLTILLGGTALWYISKFITEPVIKINAGVKKIAEGDFTVQIDHESQDEIGELSANFNKMARELNGMDYMRKDFMRNVSHEVKTPVAAITGFSEILRDGGLSKEEETEYLSYLYHESIRLSRLCDNMLSMSRLDNQAMVTNRREFYVDEQIRRCIILLEEKWTNKSIEYDLQLEQCQITCDYDLLYQVWINLIDNAIKFSHKNGTIAITVKEQDNKTGVIVKIKDEGIGIKEDKLPKIFDQFYQCEESHQKEGNGLGLSITKRIIELVGGQITCNSKEKEGSVFTILLNKQ